MRIVGTNRCDQEYNGFAEKQMEIQLSGNENKSGNPE